MDRRASRAGSAPYALIVIAILLVGLGVGSLVLLGWTKRDPERTDIARPLMDVVAVSVDADRNIFLLSRMGIQVHRFSPDGRFVRTIPLERVKARWRMCGESGAPILDAGQGRVPMRLVDDVPVEAASAVCRDSTTRLTMGSETYMLHRWPTRLEVIRADGTSEVLIRESWAVSLLDVPFPAMLYLVVALGCLVVLRGATHSRLD